MSQETFYIFNIFLKVVLEEQNSSLSQKNFFAEMKTKQFESFEKNVPSILLPQKEIDVAVIHMGNQKCTKTMQDKVESTFR